MKCCFILLLAHKKEVMLFTAADYQKAIMFINAQDLEAFKYEVSP